MDKSENKRIVTINARKFDRSIHRSWKCALIEETDEFFVLYGEFEYEVNHPQLGHIKKGTQSYEYYWKEKWFNVFRFNEPTGEFRNFYCNINMPPELSGDVLDYVDLDIDILIRRDLSLEILDRNEFKDNALIYGYSQEIVEKVTQSTEELVRLFEGKDFPFVL